MAQGWDYNDEIYFSSEGGHPEKVFTDKAKAEEAADKANLADFKALVISGEIREYAYSLDDILSDNVTEDDLMFEDGLFNSFFGMTAEDWWKNYYSRRWEERHKNNVRGEHSDEEWLKLMKCFNINFYDVVEVQKG
jgi:hypothetical protein